MTTPAPRRRVRGTVSGRAATQGFAFLGQQIYADDYRGAAILFSGQVRTPDTPSSFMIVASSGQMGRVGY